MVWFTTIDHNTLVQYGTVNCKLFKLKFMSWVEIFMPKTI